MNAEQIIETDDFKRCAEFHGHVFPGLAIVYKAAKAAMKRLNKMRAEDEETVAIVETDAFSAKNSWTTEQDICWIFLQGISLI